MTEHEGRMTKAGAVARPWTSRYSIVKERRAGSLEEANTVGHAERCPTEGIRRPGGDFGGKIGGFWGVAKGVAGLEVAAMRFLGELVFVICRSLFVIC